MFSQKQKNKLTPKSYQLEASSGFTLLELVISMALIAILTGSAIQVARFSDTHKSLTLAADEMKAVIRSAQSSSLSVPNPLDLHVCGFGVYFGDHSTPNTNTQYETFYTYVANATFVSNPKTCDEIQTYRDGSTNYVSIEKKALPAGTTINAAILDETIFFKVPYGEVYDNNGDELEPTDLDIPITIELGGNSKIITLTPSGQVE